MQCKRNRKEYAGISNKSFTLMLIMYCFNFQRKDGKNPRLPHLLEEKGFSCLLATPGQGAIH